MINSVISTLIVSHLSDHIVLHPHTCLPFTILLYQYFFIRHVEMHLYRSGSFALEVTWRKCAPYRMYRGGFSIFGSHVGCLAIDAHHSMRGEGRQIHRRRGVTQPDDSYIIYLSLISRRGWDLKRIL